MSRIHIHYPVAKFECAYKFYFLFYFPTEASSTSQPHLVGQGLGVVVVEAPQQLSLVVTCKH